MHFHQRTGNAGTCRQMPTPSAMRDVQWSTNTCTLTFQTLGVWPDKADGTDVNTVCRSNDQSLLATGDDWGKVKLFAHPAAQPKVCTYMMDALSRVMLYSFMPVYLFLHCSRCRMHMVGTAVT